MRIGLVVASALLALVVPVSGAAAAGWAPAQDIAANATGLRASAVVTRPDGSLVATWLAGPGNAADLLSAQRPAGGAWTAPVKLSGGASVAATKLGMDAAGNVVAAWVENGYVRASTLDPGGSWQPVAVPLSGSGSSGLDLATAPNGTTSVSWFENGVLKVATRTAGAAFSAAQSPATGTSPRDAALAAGPAGDVLLTWWDTSGMATRLMTAYRPAAGPQFQAPVIAAQDTNTVTQTNYYAEPALTFDTGGQATVLWLNTLVDTGSPSQTTDVWEAKTRTAGTAGTWGASATQLQAHTVPGTPLQTLPDRAVASDAGGRTTMVFESFLASHTMLSVSRASPGGTFGAPQAIVADHLSGLAGIGRSMLLLDGHGALSAALAPEAGPFGPLDAAPFAPAGTPSGMVAGGDAAGDAAVAWSLLDGATYRLRWAPYDVTAPEARALSIPAAAVAGSATAFSVTPYDALSAATATWDFGDGTAATGASVTHAYGSPGGYTVTVTVTDGAGNTSSASGPVSVVAPPGAPGGPAGAGAPGGPARPALDAGAAAPVLSVVALSPKRFRVGAKATAVAASAPGRRAVAVAAARRTKRVPTGTTVTWRLSHAASVRFALTRAAAKGKRVAAGHLTRRASAGPGRLAFSGRVGRAKLGAGSYRMTLTATDALGHASVPVTVSFTVV